MDVVGIEADLLYVEMIPIPELCADFSDGFFNLWSKYLSAILYCELDVIEAF